MCKKPPKQSGKVPIWLRRLPEVKEEFKGIKWPSASEGFEQGFELMAAAFETLGTKGLSGKLARFACRDQRLRCRWRKELVQAFSK